MALRVNFNYSAAVTQTALEGNNRLMNKSLMRLSTGLRILNAADDSAGLFIADQLAVVSAGLEQGNRNIQTGISALQIAENSAGQIYNKLKQIYVKAQSAANDINDPVARDALQREISNLVDAIGKIASDTEYNGIKLLDGTFTGKYIHYGARSNQKVNVSISSVKPQDLGAYIMDITGSSEVDNNSNLINYDVSTNFTVDASDSMTLSVGGETITLSSSQLGSVPYSGAKRFVDARVIADSINASTTAQAKGISATATNVVTASTAFGTITVGSDTGDQLQIKLYVGETLVFDKTYGSGTTIDLNTIINDINTSSLNGGRLTARDNGGYLQLESANGETIYVEATVTEGASGTSSTTFDFSKFVDATGQISSVAAGSSQTGSAVAVGDVKISGIDNFTVSTNGTLGALTVPSSTTRKDLTQIDVRTNANAEEALLIIKAAIQKVDTVRSEIGAVMNNLQSIYDAQKVAQDNTNEAENIIRNVDFSKEMSTFTTMQIRMQSGVAMLAQANTLPQLVLQLLR